MASPCAAETLVSTVTRCGAFVARGERSDALDLPVVAGEQVNATEGGTNTLLGGPGWAYH
jgi:hypothetical protein